MVHRYIVNVLWLVYYYESIAFDWSVIKATEKHLLDYVHEIDAMPDGVKNVVWCNATFSYSFAKHDLDNAMHYWQQFKSLAVIPKASMLATELVIKMVAQPT